MIGDKQNQFGPVRGRGQNSRSPESQITSTVTTEYVDMSASEQPLAAHSQNITGEPSLERNGPTEPSGAPNRKTVSTDRGIEGDAIDNDVVRAKDVGPGSRSTSYEPGFGDMIDLEDRYATTSGE